MKRAALIALLLLLIATPAALAQAANLSITFTIPTQGNSGTCAAPIFVAQSDSARVRISISGPAGFSVPSDSTAWSPRGVPITRTYANAPYGAFQVTATVVRRAASGQLVLSCALVRTVNLVDVTPPDVPAINCTSCPP